MDHPRWRTRQGRSRAPGEDPPLGAVILLPARANRRQRRRRSLRSLAAPSRTMFASGLALSLCTLAACALSVPGFVLGAEAAPAPQAAGADTVAPEVFGGGHAPDEEPSAGDLLVTLPWGDGPGQVGLQAPGEGLSRGPEAVALSPDGRIAVLDSVNRRLVLLDPEGSYIGQVALDLAEPRFLAVDDERIYVVDCDADRRLSALDWSGGTVADVGLPRFDDVVTALIATKQGPCVEVAHDCAYLVDLKSKVGSGAKVRQLPGRPLDNDVTRAARAGFTPGKGLSLRISSVDAASGKASTGDQLQPDLAPGRSIEHLVSLDGDGSGGLIVGARLDLPEDASDDAASHAAPLLLTKLQASPKSKGAPGPLSAATAAVSAGSSLLLSESCYTYLGQPYVVAPDGRVIQPVADETGYSLLVHGFADSQEVRG